MSINSQKGNNRTNNKSYNNKNRINTGLKRTFKCYKCQKTGYLSKDYPKNKDKSYFSRDLESNRSEESDLEDSIKDLDLEEEEEIEEEPLIALEEEEIILFSKENNNKREWILDSGATSHFSANKSLFINLKPTKIPVSWGKAKKIIALGKGDIRTDFNGRKITLKDALYLPKLGVNLVSITKLTKAGCEVNFKDNKVIINKDKKPLAKAFYRGNLSIIPSTLGNNKNLNTKRGL